MDFLIGGMPRGGTTALANLFHLHPDAYCYGAESHWIPLLVEFAASAPVPKASLDLAESILLQQNRQVLIEMARFSVSRGAHLRSLIFTDDDIVFLTREVAGLLRSGMYGRDLLVAALGTLRQHIQNRTGKRVIGEKTPNNLFAFARFGMLGTKATFALMREPYSVIKSMRNRGKDKLDSSANVFRSDLISLIGLYEQYASAVLETARKDSASLVRYESIVKEPVPFIEEIYRSAGLECLSDVVQAGDAHFRKGSPSLAQTEFSAEERLLIDSLTSQVRDASGYGSEFYDALGGHEILSDVDLPIDTDHVAPLSGAYPTINGEGGFWLMDSGVLMLHTRPKVTRLKLRFWSNFPETVLAKGDVPSLSIKEYGTQQHGDSPPIAQSHRGEMILDLANIPPAIVRKSSAVRLVRFSASHSFRPYLTPSPKVAGARVGDDRRLLSFLCTGCQSI